jgi:hypothetical protein
MWSGSAAMVMADSESMRPAAIDNGSLPGSATAGNDLMAGGDSLGASTRINDLYNEVNEALEQAKKSPTATASADDSQTAKLIDETLRQIQETVRYHLDQKEQLQLPSWEQHIDPRADEITENTCNLASNLLVFLDNRRSPRADEVRKALRVLTGYDPLHGKLGLADLSNPHHILIDTQDEWDLSLEEQLAHYRLICTRPHQYIPPDFLAGQGRGFCQRFLKTPAGQQQAFDHFVADLQSDPKGQLAYQLILSCSANESVADAAYTAYWMEMWNQREELITQKVQVQEWTSSRPVPLARRQKHASEMIPVLRYYLENVNNYRYWEYSWDVMWQPDQWSPVEAGEIWADYLGFKARAEADHFARGHGGLDLAELEEPFRRKFPEIAAMVVPDEVAGPLIIHRLWHPWLIPGTAPKAPVVISQTQASDDAIYLKASFGDRETEKTVLYKLGLVDFKADQIPLPEPINAGHLAATADALYLDYHAKADDPQVVPHRIGRFDLSTQTWQTRPIKLPYDSFYAVGDSLYLVSKSGIERYDWSTSQLTLLTSSHRQPALNQFDGRDDYQINKIFAGPGGKPCLTTQQDGTCYIQDGPGKWPLVFDSSFDTASTCAQEKTLIYSPSGEAVLLDPALSEPNYLMCPPLPHYRQAASARKEMTPWAGQTLWDAPEKLSLGPCLGASSHCFVQLLTPDDQQKSFQLLWYDESHGRTPRLIPLQFILGGPARDALPTLYQGKAGDRWSVDSFQQPGFGCNLCMMAVKDGICLNSDDLGVWFVPYSEIESYLKTHPTKGQDTESTVASTDKIPPPQEDAQSQIVGEMIDPAVRTVSSP